MVKIDESILCLAIPNTQGSNAPRLNLYLFDDTTIEGDDADSVNSDESASFNTPVIFINTSNSGDSTSISDTSINLDHTVDPYLHCLAGRKLIIPDIPGMRSLTNDFVNDVKVLDVDEDENVEEEGKHGQDEGEAKEDANYLSVNNKYIASYLPCF